jgi:hypothetical protein
MGESETFYYLTENNDIKKFNFKDFFCRRRLLVLLSGEAHKKENLYNNALAFVRLTRAQNSFIHFSSFQ